MLSQNVAAAAALKAELEPMILGQELPGWSCGCGACTGAAAVATAIRPGGEQYPGQEVNWALWSVSMTPKPGEHGQEWSCGLSQFIAVDDLRALFAKHFGASAGTY